jgi:WD40 repeat protein
MHFSSINRKELFIMPLPLIAAVFTGMFIAGGIAELGRQTSRAAVKGVAKGASWLLGLDKTQSKLPTVAPMIVVESPRSNSQLTKSEAIHYNRIARLRSEELSAQRNFERARLELDAALASTNEKLKKEELSIRREELVLSERGLNVKTQIAELEHEDRKKLLDLKEQELNLSRDWQKLQVEIAEAERDFRTEQNNLYWSVLRDLKKQDIEVKIAEIQSNWDSIAKNWPSTWSRLDTENILGELKRGGTGVIPLLVLAAKPNFPEDTSSLSLDKFHKQFKFRLKKRMSDFSVEYLDGFFNRKIEDADVLLLEKTIQVRPTIVLQCDVDEESLYFHVVAWGWPESESCSFPVEISLTRDYISGEENPSLTQDFQSVAEKIISAYEFISMSLIDWYYANYDLNYKPRLPIILSEYSEREKEVLSTYTEPLEKICKLNDAQLRYTDGLNFSQLGYYDQAIESFKEAQSIWPNFPGAETQIALQEQLKSNWINTQTFEVKSDTVASYAYSPDGKLLAIAKDYTVEVWMFDAGYFSCVEIINCDADSFIDDIAISQKGNMIAISRDNGRIELYSSRSGELRWKTEGYTSSITSLCFSPGGDQLASGSKDKTIKLWDVSSGDELLSLEGHSGVVRSIVFSPVDDLLFTCSDDKTVKIWNAKSGEEVHELVGHSNWVRHLTISADGRFLASASYDATIKLWEVESRKEVKTMTGHEGWVLSLSFIQGSSVLFSGGKDCDIKVWHTERGTLLKSLKGHGESVVFIATVRDGQRLITASSDNTVRVWTLN